MGLLDDFTSFLKTPEGIGVASGLAGYAMNARKGTPWNNIGRGGMAGLMGYGQAQNMADRRLEEAQQRKLRDLQMGQLQGQIDDQNKVRDFYGNLGKFNVSPVQQALSNGQGPTIANEAQIPKMAGGFNAKAMYEAMLNSGSPTLAQAGLFGLTKQDDPIKLGQGEVAYGRDGRELFRNPFQKDDSPSAIKEYKFAVDQGYKGTFEQWDTSRKRAGAASTNIITPKDVIGYERDIRKDFEGLEPVKNYRLAYPAYAAVKDAATRNTPQADINLVYGLAKLYDPGSVVREGEYNTIANSQTIPERIKSVAQQLSGGGKLTPETKQMLLKEAEGRIGVFEKEYSGAHSTYKGIVKRNGLNSDNVFTPIGRYGADGSFTQPASQQEPSGRTIDFSQLRK